jgi:FKBP-type peptidyl-prolyl cis-trans isomerase
MMRFVLAAGLAVVLAACGEKPATDGAATDMTAARTETAAPPPVPAAGPCVASGPLAAGVSDAAAWDKCVPWNTNGPGVQKTASGLEYVVLGSGPADGVSPTASDEAEVFYEGRFNAGGPAFDSAFQRGQSATFGVGRVVPGFSEALQLMKPGDHWIVYLPSKLGYGPEGKGDRIPPNADLVFEIELVKVVH